MCTLDPVIRLDVKQHATAEWREVTIALSEQESALLGEVLRCQQIADPPVTHAGGSLQRRLVAPSEQEGHRILWHRPESDRHAASSISGNLPAKMSLICVRTSRVRRREPWGYRLPSGALAGGQQSSLSRS
jgi:hypothetical protein